MGASFKLPVGTSPVVGETTLRIPEMVLFGGFFDEPKRARPKFSKKEKEMLYEHQKGKCNGCGKKFDIRNLAVDHIKAFSKGGSDRGNNTQLLCTACNSAKGAGTQAQLKKRLAAQGVIKAQTKTASKSKAAKKPTAKTRKTGRKRDPLDEFLSAFS